MSNPIKTLVNINTLQQPASSSLIDSKFVVKSSAQGGTNQVKKIVKVLVTKPDDCPLEFDSRFESGNLAAAIWKDDN